MKKILPLLFIILIASATTVVAKESVCKPQARKFYLTQGGFTGSQALTACAVGYHMASLWEIFDVSNLRYDTENGATSDDSGSGPPSVHEVSGGIPEGFGWVRTGFVSENVDPTPGRSNCNSWTTDTGFGTVVALPSAWQAVDFVVNVAPWGPSLGECVTPVPVWCVQD